MYNTLSYLLTYSLTYALTYLLTHLLTYLFTYLLIYLLTYLLTYLITYLLTYLPTITGAAKVVEDTQLAVESLQDIQVDLIVIILDCISFEESLVHLYISYYINHMI